MSDKKFTYHWLLYYIPIYLLVYYTISFDPVSHSYTFYCCKGSVLKDVFIIRRTSKRCYRVMHSDSLTVVYRSCKSISELVDFIELFSRYGVRKTLKKPSKQAQKRIKRSRTK